MEIWKDIEGYEGLYKVSNMGRVKSCPRITTESGFCCKFLVGGILKYKYNDNGYPYVILTGIGQYEKDNKHKKEKKFLVHRLVAKAFLQNPDNKPYVDHINCDITDARVDNLRWVTHRENMNNPLTKYHMLHTNNRTKRHWTTIQGKRVWY